MSSERAGIPLPVQLMQPWLEDNASFLQEVSGRGLGASRLAELRAGFAGRIGIAATVEPCALGAVDAASVYVPFGDQASILIQAVMVENDGNTRLGSPRRVTGIDGHEMSLAVTPLRVAAECRFLAAVTTPTIADTSYWSFLMEVNQAITRHANSRLPALAEAVKELVDDGIFLKMIENPSVVPMSKSSESSKEVEGISDRQIFSQILEPGEYLLPRLLVDSTSGTFGMEQRRFKAEERALLNDWFQRRLGVVFYRPHVWTRAYRIEAHLGRLCDNDWLMPLLAAVAKHTADARTVIEPWPQFLADITAKQLSGVAKLYGELNWHRHPEATYLRARTKRSRR